jgi:hypothetical protein
VSERDWRHPKLLYAVENKSLSGEWRQVENLTPFRENAERRCRAAFDHSRVRLVTYERVKVQRRKYWGDYNG